MHRRDCKVCGREFTATHNRTLCCSEECSKINKVASERMRKQKNIVMRKAIHNRQAIADIAAKAREAGMSYGQYVAMMDIH